MKRIVVTAVMFSLSACGGGGSTGSSTPIVTATPTPGPTPTIAPATLAGTVAKYGSSAALPGMTITIGTAPNASTCNAAQTASLNACGSPASPIATTMSSASGAYTITAPAGTYMLTIGPSDGSYATLHRTITLTAGANTANASLTALPAALTAWLADFNNQRLTVSSPASFPNMVVDEYAQEQAQQWANDVAAGTTAYGDAGYAPYQSAYAANPGAMYAAAGVLNVMYSGETLEQSDTEWMTEKPNCPNGDWQGCTFPSTPSGETGHYIGISNTQDVWVGLGTSATAIPGGYPTDVMIVQNVGSVGPAAKTRIR